MNLREIVNILDSISPFSLQEEWDNSGLLVGSLKEDVDKIYLTLDIDSKIVNLVEQNSLIISHHPLIFKPLKKIDFTVYPSNILSKLIEKNISLVSMHTNYDKTHLNRYVLEEVLGYKLKQSEDFLAYFDVNLPFDVFAKKIKTVFNLDCMKVTKTKEFIKDAAICTGSGASLISLVKADALLTGDIKYHDSFEAKENGLSLFDIGHFESEVYFCRSLEKELQNYGLSAIIANSKNPFIYLG